MTKDELQAKFIVAYRIVVRERTWRERVFPEGDARRDEKLREMDRLLEVMVEMKDEIKAYMEKDDLTQPKLLDVPRRASYE
jgi:hypothetical protein